MKTYWVWTVERKHQGNEGLCVHEITEFTYVSFRGFTCERLEGLYFYLNHFIVSILYSIPNNRMRLRTAVPAKKLGNFFSEKIRGT